MLVLKSEHLGIKHWENRIVRWYCNKTEKLVICDKDGNMVVVIHLPEDRIHQTDMFIDGREAKVYGGVDSGHTLFVRPSSTSLSIGLWNAISTLPPFGYSMWLSSIAQER